MYFLSIIENFASFLKLRKMTSLSVHTVQKRVNWKMVFFQIGLNFQEMDTFLQNAHQTNCATLYFSEIIKIIKLSECCGYSERWKIDHSFLSTLYKFFDTLRKNDYVKHEVSSG